MFCEDIQKELLLAAEMGKVDLIRGVISSFIVDLNFVMEKIIPPLPWKETVTCLILAARNGHADVAHLLLDEGADPNLADKHRSTPVHWAAFKGHQDVAQLLLDGGA